MGENDLREHSLDNVTENVASNGERENSTQIVNRPSLENPTWDYLFHNFTKPQLQKHCRQLGLSKIWQTKEKLIDMIMRSHQSTRRDETSRNHDDQSLDPLARVLEELEGIKEKLAMKDVEIEQLNEIVQNAHVTINRLNDRISSLEEKINDQSTCNTARPSNDKILLLGDENLTEVRPSDLGEDCFIKTIKDTNMDLTRCWIDERLDWVPGKCVIYCGSNDLAETENLSTIFDHLGQLISELKDRNGNMELFVCELVPSTNGALDDKISEYNEKLKQWTNVNGIKVINTNLNFRIGTGEVDDLCYNVEGENPHSVLNRYGVLRLLSVINKQCDRFKLNENFKRSISNLKYNHSPFSNHNNNDPPASQRIMNWGSHTQSRQYHHSTSSRLEQRNQYEDRRAPNGGNRFMPRNNQYKRNYMNHINNDDRYHHRSLSDHHMNHQNYNSNGNWHQHGRFSDHGVNGQPGGCCNCGEHNHRQSNCRYDHRIRCNLCHKFGHKNRMCNLLNES